MEIQNFLLMKNSFPFNKRLKKFHKRVELFLCKLFFSLDYPRSCSLLIILITNYIAYQRHIVWFMDLEKNSRSIIKALIPKEEVLGQKKNFHYKRKIFTSKKKKFSQQKNCLRKRKILTTLYQFS